MRFSTLSVYLLFAVPVTINTAPTSCNGTGNSTDEGAAICQLNDIQKQYKEYINATLKTRSSGCTSKNRVYRQEWGTLSKEARHNYIKAVECLRQKPARSPKDKVPGARSLFDDFQATHMIVASHVHSSGLFFHFHRYFTWLYEKTLQDECGYTGTQPYWDWNLNWQDPRQSTVFDGSDASMGSNGKVVPNGSTNTSAFGVSLSISPGTGGGCIERGPFANTTVNLGPVAFQPKGPDNGLGYNPRCLTRDLNPGYSNQTKPSDVVNVINNANDLGTFDFNFEAPKGVHAGGHFTMGGLGLDAFASPGDPAFYLQHAQVDRVWAMWQALKPEERLNQVYGTSTAFNNPPSPNVTLDSEIDFGMLADKQRLGSLISTIDGPFCYAYI